MTTRPPDVIADVLMFGNRFLTQEVASQEFPGLPPPLPTPRPRRGPCPEPALRRPRAMQLMQMPMHNLDMIKRCLDRLWV